jgi:ABC-type phosphate transport system substrate-binding protein
MDRRLKRFRVVLVTVLVTLSLTAFAGGVSAAPGTTPNGHTGSCNMLQAYGAGAQGGIVNAWSHADASGFAGMWRSVAESGTENCAS